MNKAEVDEETKGSNAQTPSAGQQFILNSSKLAALAMKGADRPTQVTVYVLYIVSSVCLIVLLTPPYEVLKQLIILCVMVVAILYSATKIFDYYKIIERGRPLRPEPSKEQVPPVVQEGWPPLSELQLTELAEFVERIRIQACKFLRNVAPALDENHVRSNIFFPFYGKSRDPNDFTLMIHPRLHCKMEKPEELSVKFEPGQGLTGRVFQFRTPGYTKILDSKTGEWDETFRITRRLKRQIDPNLIWILSMPLKNWDGKPMGVVNVDGLFDDLSQDTLKNCLQSIIGSTVLESSIIWPPPI